MAFSPSWNVKKQVGNRALIGTAPDPLHGTQSTHDYQQSSNGGIEPWMSQVTDPGTSDVLVGEGTDYDNLSGGGGPVDYTPIDHTFGDGVGAGLTDGQSQDENAAWRGTDLNATAARRWSAPPPSDGPLHAERLQQPASIGLAGSPETMLLQYGTNPEAYPNGQTNGHRIWRWRDRVFDRRTYTPDHRPLYTPNAYSAPDVPAGSGPYTSPSPQMGQVNVLMEKAPQLRRTPTNWSDPVVTDPTSNVGYVEAPLDVWGM
jgi:hypothetical protein